MRPQWSPTSFEQVVAEVAGRVVAESRYTDFKRDDYGRSEGERRKAAVDMASLAIDGGTLVLGVGENKESGLAEQVCPIPVSGVPEWLAQIARLRVDPPLQVHCTVLNDPTDPARGVIVVHVPASPVIVHQVDGVYRGRADRINVHLGDGEVERLLRLREVRTDRIREVLKATAAAIRPRMQPDHTRPVGWLMVAIEPTPVRDPFLLRAQLADNAIYPGWLQRHALAATDALFAQLQASPAFAREVAGNWSPQRGQWTLRRTGTGVERSATGRAHTDTPLATVLAVDESGAVRLSYNYLVYGPTGGDDRDIVCWQDLIGATLWTLGFASQLVAEAGVASTLAVGVHAEGIGGMTPGEPNDGVFGQQRRDRSLARDPIPLNVYDEVTLVSVAELAGDWWHATDRLFGQLLRAMGLGDLLASA